MKNIISIIAPLFFGLIFGVGLIISGMIDTKNVIGFLDISGNWKPALAFVMGGAILVGIPLFYWAKKREAPFLGGEYSTQSKIIDRKLIIGAVIFGIGWSLVGLCPGPSIVWLGIDPISILPFIVSFIIGSALVNKKSS